jgi:hypothetical protein
MCGFFSFERRIFTLHFFFKLMFVNFPKGIFFNDLYYLCEVVAKKTFSEYRHEFFYFFNTDYDIFK